MKSKEFEKLIVQLERDPVNERVIKEKQTIELLNALKRYITVYSPIIYSQFEKRITKCLPSQKQESFPLPFFESNSFNMGEKEYTPFVFDSIQRNDYENLNGSTIELNAVKSLSINGCKECRFTKGIIEQSSIIRNCKDCIFEIKSSQIRITGCVNCKFIVFCTTNPVIEDSKGLVFSKLNFNEEDENNNKWNKVRDFSSREDSFLIRD